MISPSRDLNDSTKNKDERIPKKAVHQRSVKFDGNVVSAVYGPPQRWTNVEPLNSDELVAAYKLRCESEGTEPFYTVLKQLQDMDLRRTPRVRRACFNLKGIQLTESHVETLEVIFKHVQFEHLNLENTNLTDSTIGILCDMIEFYDSCTELSLARNPRITSAGWMCIFQLVQKLPYIRWLDLRDAKLDESAARRLTASIGSQATFERIEDAAHEDSNQSADTDHMTEHLTDSDASHQPASHPICAGLQGLHLGSTFIQRPELLRLLNRIRLSLICDLRLPGNKLDPTGAASLIPLIRYGASLRYLDLGQNELQDEGCAMISDALASTAFTTHSTTATRCGLRRLDLSSNQLSEHSMTALGQALAKSQQLVCLQLSHNPGLGCAGVLNLQFGLLRCRQLRRLGLASCNIRCSGAVSLAEVLLDRPRRLKVIDLTDNTLGTAGLLAFARCFGDMDGPVRIKGVLTNPSQTVNHVSIPDSMSSSTAASDQTPEMAMLYNESHHKLSTLLEQNLATFPDKTKDPRPRYSEMHCPCASDQSQLSTHSDSRYFWGDSSDDEEAEDASPSGATESVDVTADPF